MQRTLVVTADDLGVHPARDRGIFLAHAQGAVSQASLLVNGISAACAARQARARGLSLGLHLNLTEGRPCSASPRTLVGADGLLRGKFGFRLALAAEQIDLGEVVGETTAQLAAFERLCGHPASHVDGHQHVHVLPEVAAVLAPLLAEAGVRTTRIPHEAQPTIAFHHAVSAAAATARATFAQAGIGSSQTFVGLNLMGMSASADGLLSALAGCGAAASTEYMCHPGFPATEGDIFNQSPARRHELQVLTDGLREQLRESGYALVAFGAGRS